MLPPQQIQRNVLRFRDLDSWTRARELGSATFGTIPSSFTTTVRTLMYDYRTNNRAYSDASRFLAKRLLRGPTINACVSRAYTMWKNEFDDKERPPETYLDEFSPYDLATLIGFLYLFKRARRSCKDPQLEAIVSSLMRSQHLGIKIAQVIPNVGLGTSLIVSGMHQVASAAFLFSDSAGFADYRRHLNNAQSLYDGDYEHAVWGCSGTQIAATLIQSAGFGLGIASSFTAAFSSMASLESQPNRIAYAMRACWVWLDTLLRKDKLPSSMRYGEVFYYPSSEDLDRLLECVALGPPESEAFWLNTRATAKPSAPEAPVPYVPRKLRRTNEEEDRGSENVDLDELAAVGDELKEEIEAEQSLL